MKLKSLLGLLCLLVIVFSSCEQEEVVQASGSCTFAFDSASYSANDSRGYATDTVYKDLDTTFTGKALTIQSLTNSLNSHLSITVIFPDTLAVGTYTGANYASILFTASMSNQTYFTSLPAIGASKPITIKITSINSKYAEGEFFGTLTNGEIDKPLTDGKFKVNIY
jgi:hypothetical protein